MPRDEGLRALPLLGRFLLVDPLGEAAALVNGAALKALVRGELGVPELFPGSRAPRRSRPESAVADPFVPLFLGIVPSRRCDMACAYCAFASGDSGEVLEGRLAAAAVRSYAELCSRAGLDELRVQFFGGEPFVEMEIVETVVHAARFAAADRGLVARIEACTNGFCDEPTAAWVGDYFDSVTLSFDGLAAQDRHRPGRGGLPSAARVERTAAIFALSQARLELRACVSELNQGELEAIALRAAERYRPDVLVFEPLAPCGAAIESGLSPPDPLAFASSFLRARRSMVPFGVRVVHAVSELEGPRASSCPVGRNALILSPGGALSACYLPREESLAAGFDLDLGRVDEEGRIELDHDSLLRVAAAASDKEACEACFCRWSCAGGCVVHNRPPGSTRAAGSGGAAAYPDFCRLTRLLSLCSILEGMGQGELAEELCASPEAARGLCEPPERGGYDDRPEALLSRLGRRS
jgi:uncharacterized protein